MAEGVDGGLSFAAFLIIFASSAFAGICISIVFEGWQVPCTSRKYGPYITKFYIPSLLGMLLFTIILRNLPNSPLKYVDSTGSSILRRISLIVILLRAGMALDLVQLKKQSSLILSLSLIPLLLEASVLAILSKFLFSLPWTISFALGFAVGPVSPAVVVPSLIKLSHEGYGVAKGIPTLTLASASFDNIIAISGFSIFLALIFQQSSSISLQVARPFIEIFGGIFLGLVLGYLFKFISRSPPLLRLFLLLSVAIGAAFLTELGTVAGVGRINAIALSACAGHFWPDKHLMQTHLKTTWKVFEPVLFGLVGAAVDLSSMQTELIGLFVVIIVIGLCVRIPAAILSISGGRRFTLKEKAFVGVAWSPKATVQAAVGSQILDTAILLKAGDEYIGYGRLVLSVAVISILLTAPFGAIGIAYFGPRWLSNHIPAPTLASVSSLPPSSPPASPSQPVAVIDVSAVEAAPKEKEVTTEVEIEPQVDVHSDDDKDQDDI
eukprot:GILI01040358.1.p1 GENE.GILI01040358.1~~GILI01040358.1.p1  ORF type:complete len:493 (+),score=118.15 GILI01040358.1:37-1515(+)